MEYQMEKVDANHYTVTRERSDELYGEYTVEIDYSYEAGKWVFEDRSQVERGEGGEMPDTSNALPMKAISGILLTAAGALLLVGRKRLNH
ncbi:hypothetical protein [Halobacillus mangrovi]|nr:hypothetical protein [Halobacillus mangrovi]